MFYQKSKSLYPFQALGYIFGSLAWYFLDEKINNINLIGLIFISVGLIILSLECIIVKDNIIIIGGSGLVGKAIVDLKEITSEFNIFVLDKQCKINKELANFIQSDINKRFFYKDIINLLPKNFLLLI